PVIYSLSLHDALPISLGFSRWMGGSSSAPAGWWSSPASVACATGDPAACSPCSAACSPCLAWCPSPLAACTTSRRGTSPRSSTRSEEHTSELQSLRHL